MTQKNDGKGIMAKKLMTLIVGIVMLLLLISIIGMLLIGYATKGDKQFIKHMTVPAQNKGTV